MTTLLLCRRSVLFWGQYKVQRLRLVWLEETETPQRLTRTYQNLSLSRKCLKKPNTRVFVKSLRHYVETSVRLLWSGSGRAVRLIPVSFASSGCVRRVAGAADVFCFTFYGVWASNPRSSLSAAAHTWCGNTKPAGSFGTWFNAQNPLWTLLTLYGSGIFFFPLWRESWDSDLRVHRLRTEDQSEAAGTVALWECYVRADGMWLTHGFMGLWASSANMSRTRHESRRANTWVRKWINKWVSEGVRGQQKDFFLISDTDSYVGIFLQADIPLWR